METVQNITVIKDFRMYVCNSCYIIPDNTIYKSVINSMQTDVFRCRWRFSLTNPV